MQHLVQDRMMLEVSETGLKIDATQSLVAMSSWCNTIGSAPNLLWLKQRHLAIYIHNAFDNIEL